MLAVSRALPTYVDIRGKQVLTSIVRERSSTPLVLDAAGAQGNRTAVHTEHLLGFSVENYAYWADRFGLPPGVWPLTHWGENITFEGLVEEDLPIGTTLRVGPSAVLQVTSPRNPCFKLSWRLGQPDGVLNDILSSGRPGFYLRVIEPGPIFDGDGVVAQRPACPAPSVAEVARLMSGAEPAGRERFQAVIATPGIGVQCAGMLRQALTKHLDRDRLHEHRWPGWRPFAVREIDDAAADVRSFRLVPCDGGGLPAFRAGQHVRVRLPAQDGTLVTRSWSLSDYEEHPGTYRLSIKRSRGGAASTAMHETIRVGSRIELSAPSGTFCLDRSSNHPTILISAGIGLTPLLAMVKAYAELGPDAPPAHWIHVTRNGASYPHSREIETLLRGHPNLLRHVRFTAPLPSDRLGRDYDAFGRLTLDTLRAEIATYRYPIFGREVELPGAAGEFYLCGPAEFETDMRAMLKQLGAADGVIRSESFGIAGSRTIGERSRVRFARAGVEMDWEPGWSLLDCAEAAGIAAEHECRAGSCHRCSVEVLEGEAAYIREPAVRPGPRMVLVCCSRPATPELVLDL